MDFSLLKQIVDSINGTITNTAVVAVKTLRTNLFSVKVTNPTTKVEVKGQVTVANQKNVETLLKEVKKTVKDLASQTSKVQVTNPTAPVQLSNLEQKVSEVSKSVEKLIPELKNVAKEAKSSKTEEVTVSNQPIKELEAVLKALQSLDLKVKLLKLDPTIKVAAPIIPAPVVNVSPTPVTVEKDEFDYEKMVEMLDKVLHAKNAGKYVPVRLSNGKDFYDAITNIVGGGGSSGGVKIKQQPPIDGLNPLIYIKKNFAGEVVEVDKIIAGKTYKRIIPRTDNAVVSQITINAWI